MLNRFLLGIGFIVVVGVALLVAIWELNRERADIGTANVEVEVAADEIYFQFSNNEPLANEQYLGKVIQVSGSILQINDGLDEQLNVFLDGGNGGMVMCVFPVKPGTALEIGDSLTLKCLCTGFLLDVILNDCVVIKEKEL